MLKIFQSFRSCFFLVAVASSFSLNAVEDIDLTLLQEAWTIPGGGSNGRPYYSLDIEGIHFQGEREWEPRWLLIQNAMDYENKRILELGCNVSLTSIYLIKYCGALSAQGVDRPNEGLAKCGMPRLMEAAKLTQMAFGVDIDILQTDMNNSYYEELIGKNFDVVICMSLLKWITDKERFLQFLSQFNHIIYEGHDADDIEIARFQSLGFQYKILGETQIGISYPPNAYRTLIYFYKEGDSRYQ